MSMTSAVNPRFDAGGYGRPVETTPHEAARATAAIAAPPAGINRQRITIVSVFTAVATIASAVGYMPREVPAILVLWVGGLWFASLMAQRVGAARSLDVNTVSYCFNAVLLTLVCYHLGGSTWLAGTFYALLVLVAGAGLPRARAILVALIAWVGFAVLAIGPAAGLIEPPAFGFTDPRSTDLSFAVVTAVFQAIALGTIVALQQWLVGTLRAAAQSSRALIEAATDIVVILDRNGEIYGSNTTFAESSSGRPGSTGASINDIVTEKYRGYLQLKLAQATSGKKVPFEVSYRGEQGDERWLTGTLVPLPAEDADPRVLLIGRDMTLEHEMTAETAAAVAREAVTHRTRTFERTIIDVAMTMERSLGAIRDRARVLRARKQSQEDADHANAIFEEAEKLRVEAQDLLRWMTAVRGKRTPPERPAQPQPRA